MFANLSLLSILQMMRARDWLTAESNEIGMRILLLSDSEKESERTAQSVEAIHGVGQVQRKSAEYMAELTLPDLLDCILLLQLSNETIAATLEALQQKTDQAKIVVISETATPYLQQQCEAGLIEWLNANELWRIRSIVKTMLRQREMQAKLDRVNKELAGFEPRINNLHTVVKSKAGLANLLLASITDSIALIDPQGTIVHTNQKWRDFATENHGTPAKCCEGANYLEACQKAFRNGDELAGTALDGIKNVLTGKEKSFELEYPCHSDTARRWFLMRVTPCTEMESGALIAHADITDKKQKEFELAISYKEILASEKINAALISGATTESLANFMLDHLYEAAGVERSRIYIYDKAQHRLQLYASRISNELVKKLEKKTGIKISTVIPVLTEENIFTQTIRKNEAIITSDQREIIRIVADHAPNAFLRTLARWAHQLVGIKTFAIIPLTQGEEVVGVLSTASPVILNERERNTLLRISQQVSLTMARKLEQENLQRNEEKFRAISNYTANWETWFDVTGKPIWTNPAVVEHSGYTDQELLSMPNYFETIIYKDDLPLVMKTLKEALADKTVGDNLEIRTNHKNGSHPWFSVSWKQLFDSSGNWMGIRTSGIDITQRKNQALELIRKQAELNEVQEIARLGSWEWHISREQIVLNRALCRMLGIPDSQQIQQQDDFLKMVDEDSKNQLEQAIIHSKDSFNPSDIELKLTTPEGHPMYFLVRASFSNQGSEEQTVIRGSALDITELKHTHDQVRENQERFKKIFESIQDVYYQTNREGIITIVSPSVEKLLGYTPEEVVGKSISMFFLKPKLQELRMARRHLLGQHDEFETTLLSKSGDEVVVSINLSFLKEEQGKHVIIQGLMRNITEKKRQEKSLENQRKRLLEIVKLNTQIIQTSDHFYYVIQISDPDNRLKQLKYVSTPVTAILGLTELDLLNREKRWRSLVLPEDVHLLDTAIEAIFREKKPQKVSYRIRHNRTGEIIWLDDYVCPLLNGNNEVVEIYGSVKDVSERMNLIFKIEAEKKQSIAYQYQLLSSQLNPHFIYNTLNTFQYYILQGNIEGSLNHISDFSKLMRKVLENSMYNYISLDEEIEFLEHYMRISKQRMKEPLEFTISVDDDVETADVMIPPMLLQPYLENAMIHGFNECPRKPTLKLIIHKKGHLIQCIIEDNGIGREKSIRTKGNRSESPKRSYAMGINKNRIDLLNQITDLHFEVAVEDLKDPEGQALGTRVNICYHEVLSDITS